MDDNIIEKKVSDLLEGSMDDNSELLETDSETIIQDNCEGRDTESLIENDSEEVVNDGIIENDSEELVSPPKKSKKEETNRYRPLHLPLARIKQIIKMDPDVNLAGSDAVFLIAKATEMFIELLSKDAYAFTASSKKKTIQKKDVDAAIVNTDALVFLDGAMEF